MKFNLLTSKKYFVGKNAHTQNKSRASQIKYSFKHISCSFGIDFSFFVTGSSI